MKKTFKGCRDSRTAKSTEREGWSHETSIQPPYRDLFP